MTSTFFADLSRIDDDIDEIEDAVLDNPDDDALSRIFALTVTATIFLPLTFLTGFVGQSFSFLIDHMVNTTWSFIVFGVGLSLASVIGFLIYFLTRRWI